MEKLTATLTTISTVVGTVLAQFAPWLQSPVKAVIGAACGLVVIWYNHEHQATTRTKVAATKPVVALPPAPPVPVYAVPPPAPAVPS